MYNKEGVRRMAKAKGFSMYWIEYFQVNFLKKPLKVWKMMALFAIMFLVFLS